MNIQDPHAPTVMGNTFSNYCKEGYEYGVSKTTELREYVSSQVSGLRNPETRAQAAYNLTKLTAKAALVAGLCFLAYKELTWPGAKEQIHERAGWAYNQLVQDGLYIEGDRNAYTASQAPKRQYTQFETNFYSPENYPPYLHYLPKFIKPYLVRITFVQHSWVWDLGWEEFKPSKLLEFANPFIVTTYPTTRYLIHPRYISQFML